MNAHDTRLVRRTALVTGSTGGLGTSIAEALAAAGVYVVVTGRNEVRGDAVVTGIRAVGGEAAFVAGDLAAGQAEVRRIADAAVKSADGRIDILVNNAGIFGMPTPTSEIDEEGLFASLRTNVVAPFLLTSLLAPPMARRGGGAIVNIGSITGFNGAEGSALYSATKAATHSLTKSWAAEYGPHGVRVNAVAPGPIATERNAEYADHLTPVLARIPSRRMSTPQEVAAAVVFLAGDGAANVHGAILPVDGGWAAVS